MTYQLGRLPAPDPRDKAFRMSALIPAEPSRPYRYWWSDWFGDQGETSSCVGFSWIHWLVSGPTTQTSRNWQKYAMDIYYEAQMVDEWEGTNYEGTSVRAGAKALQAYGFITEYRWAWTADEIVRAVLDVGPVVVGTVWTTAMFEPVNGYIFPAGFVEGGHAYLIEGANLDRGVVRVKNSWGQSWGRNGRAWLKIDDLAWLMAQEGEAALASEVRL